MNHYSFLPLRFVVKCFNPEAKHNLLNGATNDQPSLFVFSNATVQTRNVSRQKDYLKTLGRSFPDLSPQTHTSPILIHDTQRDAIIGSAQLHFLPLKKRPRKGGSLETYGLFKFCRTFFREVIS